MEGYVFVILEQIELFLAKCDKSFVTEDAYNGLYFCMYRYSVAGKAIYLSIQEVKESRFRFIYTLVVDGEPHTFNALLHLFNYLRKIFNID